MGYFHDHFTTPQNSTRPILQLTPSEGVSNACARGLNEKNSNSITIENGELTANISSKPGSIYHFLGYDFSSPHLTFPPMTISTTVSPKTTNTYSLEYVTTSNTRGAVNGKIVGNSLSFELDELTNVEGFGFSVSNENGASPFTFGPLIGGPTCISGDSLVLTKQSYKPISQLQREDEIEGGRIAAIIKDKLPSYIRIVKIGNVKACSDHVLIHNGKRILAKDYPDAEIIYGKTEDLLPDPYLYDIQFDFEGSYFLEGGLESQSRSPYCHLTPLDKEKYFNLDNYRSVRVDNTLRLDPPFN